MMSSISDRIKAIKLHFGIRTNVELARIAHCSKQRVGNWLNSDQVPSQDALIALRQNLGVNDEWVLTGKGSMLVRPQDNDFIEKIRKLEEHLSEEDKQKILVDILYFVRKNSERN